MLNLILSVKDLYSRFIWSSTAVLYSELGSISRVCTIRDDFVDKSRRDNLSKEACPPILPEVFQSPLPQQRNRNTFERKSFGILFGKSSC